MKKTLLMLFILSGMINICLGQIQIEKLSSQQNSVSFSTEKPGILQYVTKQSNISNSDQPAELPKTIDENPYLTITVQSGIDNLTERKIISDPLALRKNTNFNTELFLNKDYSLVIPNDVIMTNVFFSETAFGNTRNVEYSKFIIPYKNGKNSIFKIIPINRDFIGNYNRTSLNDNILEEFKKEINSLKYNADYAKKINIFYSNVSSKFELYFTSENYKENENVILYIHTDKFSKLPGKNNKYFRDDLTISDYAFYDSVGYTTLGTLRKWVCDRYDNFKGNLWSKFDAITDVHLNNRSLFFGEQNTYNINADENENILSIKENKSPLISFVSTLCTTNVEFNIVKNYITNNIAHVYVAKEECDNPKLVMPSSYTDETAEWVEIPGQTSSYPETEIINDKECYHLSVSIKDLGDKFIYSVKGNPKKINVLNREESIICYAKTWHENDIIIKSTNGKRFKLIVDDQGNLTTLPITNSLPIKNIQ